MTSVIGISAQNIQSPIVPKLASINCAYQHLSEKGVSQDLAILRAKEISQVEYQVLLDIPSDKNEWVKGHVTISFHFSPQEEDKPFLIDFQGHAVSPSCFVNGKQAPTGWKDEHIQIPRSLLSQGKLRTFGEQTYKKSRLNLCFVGVASVINRPLNRRNTTFMRLPIYEKRSTFAGTNKISSIKELYDNGKGNGKNYRDTR